MKYSINELNYIKENIFMGIRSDMRKPLESRDVKYFPTENTHADGSLVCKRGYSTIRIDLEFNIEKIVESNFNFPQYIYKELENLPGLGLNIKLEIYNDDGNIMDLAINGLRHLLEKIEIPEIVNKDDLIQIKDQKIITLQLPQVKTFAIFDSLLITDPIKLEEESCDALATVIFKDIKIISFIMHKSGEINEEVLNLIIENI